jgi:hypothetical protein
MRAGWLQQCCESEAERCMHGSLDVCPGMAARPSRILQLAGAAPSWFGESLAEKTGDTKGTSPRASVAIADDPPVGGAVRRRSFRVNIAGTRRRTHETYSAEYAYKELTVVRVCTLWQVRFATGAGTDSRSPLRNQDARIGREPSRPPSPSSELHVLES